MTEIQKTTNPATPRAPIKDTEAARAGASADNAVASRAASDAASTEQRATACYHISDIASASKWLQDHAHAECTDRDHLVKFCELLQKPPKKENKEEWHRVLATWKTGSIERQSKN